ncbi:MAG: peroxiredoxin [Planctomycetota bacterium]|nr:peroxiredoxin [Planctomycetota bacterium]
MRTNVLLSVLSLGAACLGPGCQADVPVYEMPRVQEEAASMRSPIVGLPAPDFSLPNHEDKPVSLQSLRGQWVVLYFYPKDDTPGCTCQATQFNRLQDALKGRNTKVVGVSADSPRAHRLFVEKFKLHIDLLSDADHAVSRSYGAWVDARLGEKKYERMIRSTILVDPQGVVRYHWPEVIPNGHAERVAEKVALLQAGPKPAMPTK